MSEVYGRTLPVWMGMVAFCIFQIPVAVAQNIQTIFVCRFLQAIFGAAPVGVLGGLYVDILEPIEIGVALSVFAGVVFASPAAGPIVGSFLTQSSLGWRWTAWITLVVGAIFTSMAWAVTPETFAPLILRRKAKRMRYKTKNWALHAESEEQQVDLRALVTKYLTKPIRMLLKEPIVSNTVEKSSIEI
jgi:MFS family permease